MFRGWTFIKPAAPAIVEEPILREPFSNYVRDDCTMCSHTWHGLTCRHCPCEGPFSKE